MQEFNMEGLGERLSLIWKYFKIETIGVGTQTQNNSGKPNNLFWGI